MFRYTGMVCFYIDFTSTNRVVYNKTGTGSNVGWVFMTNLSRSASVSVMFATKGNVLCLHPFIPTYLPTYPHRYLPVTYKLRSDWTQGHMYFHWSCYWQFGSWRNECTEYILFCTPTFGINICKIRIFQWQLFKHIIQIFNIYKILFVFLYLFLPLSSPFLSFSLSFRRAWSVTRRLTAWK